MTDLPHSAQRHIRVFQTHQFLDRLAMGLTVAVVALALVDRGMSVFQIALLFGLYSATTMVLELPFGGLADNVGRKPVFLFAVGASLVSLALFLSSSNFYVLAASFAFIGLGRALRSGTLDAWFVEGVQEKAPGVDIQPALAKAQCANAMGLGCGAVLGGLLPDMLGGYALRIGFGIYDVSYAASFCLMVLVFLYTRFAIDEAPPSRQTTALSQGIKDIPSVIKDAARLALERAEICLVLLALALVLMATNPVEALWPTQAKPMLDPRYASTVVGGLTAAYFFAYGFGASLAPRLAGLFQRNHAITLSVTLAILAFAQVGLAMQGHIFGFATVLLTYAMVIGASEPSASAILHANIEDRYRSTLLSLRSLLQQGGAVIGFGVIGFLAKAYSTPIAWACGAGCICVAVVLVLRIGPKTDAS